MRNVAVVRLDASVRGGVHGGLDAPIGRFRTERGGVVCVPGGTHGRLRVPCAGGLPPGVRITSRRCFFLLRFHALAFLPLRVPPPLGFGKPIQVKQRACFHHHQLLLGLRLFHCFFVRLTVVTVVPAAHLTATNAAVGHGPAHKTRVGTRARARKRTRRGGVRRLRDVRQGGRARCGLAGLGVRRRRPRNRDGRVRSRPVRRLRPVCVCVVLRMRMRARPRARGVKRGARRGRASRGRRAGSQSLVRQPGRFRDGRSSWRHHPYAFRARRADRPRRRARGAVSVPIPVTRRRHMRSPAGAVRPENPAQQRLALQLASRHRLPFLRHLLVVPPSHIRGFPLLRRHQLFHLPFLVDVLLVNWLVRKVLGNHGGRRGGRRAAPRLPWPEGMRGVGLVRRGVRRGVHVHQGHLLLQLRNRVRCGGWRRGPLRGLSLRYGGRMRARRGEIRGGRARRGFNRGFDNRGGGGRRDLRKRANRANRRRAVGGVRRGPRRRRGLRVSEGTPRRGRRGRRGPARR
mmetsp:Transcript_12275/g.40812  ORF Transcript_12275/g.40812 Transcript_12275/m.40812 type:complete len:515 (-) Transcript_12275:2632-4176(-)